MPITYEGAVAVDGTGGNVSQSITVPSGAELAIVTESFYDAGAGSGANSVSSCTLDGETATVINNLADTASLNSLYQAWIKDFGTGSVTFVLNRDSDETIAEGGEIYISFWSGVDLTTPIDDSATGRRDTTGSADITLDSASADQVFALHASVFYTGSEDSDISTTAASPTETAVYNGDLGGNSQIVDVSYFTFPTSGSKTFRVATDTYNYSFLQGVVLNVGDAVVITDVDTDETWNDGDTGLVITGTGFV